MKEKDYYKTLLFFSSTKKIFDYLEVHFQDSGLEVNNFSVGTNYPKKNFDDTDSTIEAEVMV